MTASLHEVKLSAEAPDRAKQEALCRSMTIALVILERDLGRPSLHRGMDW